MEPTGIPMKYLSALGSANLILHLLAITILSVTANGAHAQSPNTEPPQKEWSISPILGIHAPALDSLNSGVLQSPFAAKANIIIDSGASDETLFQFPNPLPPLGPAAYGGIEFEWAMTPRVHWISGLGTWESSTSAITSGTMPFQGKYSETIYERRLSLSYNEVYFGGRYNILLKPKHYRFYGRFTLNTLFDIDYRENQRFRFKIEDGQLVTKSIIFDGRSTAALATQTGLGAEYYVGDRFAFSLEADITLSTRKFYLTPANYETDFEDHDGYPLFYGTVNPDDFGRLEYLTISEEGETSYRPMPLDINGWKVLFRVSMFY